MKRIKLIVLLLSLSAKGQNVIAPQLKASEPLNVSTLISIDESGSLYYLNGNEFTKETKSQALHYTNLKLGTLSSVNTFNPLKINLFYSDFNTVIILDNRLAELFKIDFNTITPYRNPSHITSGYDTTVWIFNLNTQQLELYDYKTNLLRAFTTPIAEEVLSITSNYNACWLLTQDYIYEFNYVGSLINKIKNEGFTKLQETNGNLFLQKDNQLYILKKDTSDFREIKVPDLLIKQFFVTNETLYIYDQKTLKQFQI